MNVQDLINAYIAGQPEQKRFDMQQLHQSMLRLLPDGKLWFDDGKDATGKVITNPTIGYGFQTLKYANGKTREFFQIGISANTTGISVYILGLTDKTYLARTFGKEIGKATVTGYCIKFKLLQDINMEILEAAIRYGLQLNT